MAAPEDLPVGAVVTASGRVSQAVEFSDQDAADQPFSAGQLNRIDEALTLTSRDTGLHFSIYVGDLGEDVAARGAQLHGELADASRAVLIAVSPGQRQVEVVVGGEARRRVPDRVSRLAIEAMVSSFKESDLVGGLLRGLQSLGKH